MNNYKLSNKKTSTHSIILKLLGQNNDILDAGCNDGYIGASDRRNNRFWGLELSADSVKSAKRIYVDAIEYDLQNTTKLPWHKRFDVLLFADVLEHLTDYQNTLTFFVKYYLKQDGMVLISVPNVANWTVRLSLLFGKFQYTDTGILDKSHYHLFTFKSAVEMAKEANLQIVQIRGGSDRFGRLIDLVPILRGLLSTNIIILCKISSR